MFLRGDLQKNKKRMGIRSIKENGTMPATYAHYVFGKEVQKGVSKDIRRIILEHKEVYLIGLHGPDILFYYKPLKKNPISTIGYQMHDEVAAGFFKQGREVIRKLEGPEKEEAIAYMFGFVCHFMLDSECHGYIREKMKSSGITHAEIESEFDRALLVKAGKNPIRECLVKHIVPGKKNAACIARFFKGVSAKEIQEAIRSFKTYNNLLRAPGKGKRQFIYTALKASGKYEHLKGMVINYEPNPHCKGSCLALTLKLQNAILPAARLIEEYYRSLDSISPLSERFNCNFE